MIIETLPKKNIRKRIEEKSNYTALFLDGKTLRMHLEPNKPINELEYPEFYDIKITDKCNGKCEWCYMDSLPEKSHFKNIVKKVNAYFDSMDSNQKPFQVAIGGGEPTHHPEFNTLINILNSMDILPNYTTNGIQPEKYININTLKKVGGVAISCHPHMRDIWHSAYEYYHNKKTFLYDTMNKTFQLNFHIIISDKDSINYAKDIMTDYLYEGIDNFVLLPHENIGRAIEKEIDYNIFSNFLTNFNIQYGSHKKIAFGANFYSFLKNNWKEIGITPSLYEPELFSKFISLKDNGYMYKSSFSKNIIKRNFLMDKNNE